jgi:hypothetical protein
MGGNYGSLFEITVSILAWTHCDTQDSNYGAGILKKKHLEPKAIPLF